MLEAIGQEIRLQKDYLDSKHLETIYFGGGTPSLLITTEIQKLLETVSQYFTIDTNAEITLEANPDDLSKEKVIQLRQSPVNRLSIGIQSFYEPHLQYMHRAHTATEAATCVKQAQDAGFDNLTIDLIYGIPHPDHSVWEADLQKATELDVSHLSAYCLTIEPQTVFGKWVKQKKIALIDEDHSAAQFELMLNRLEAANFEQYEISNFAKQGKYARHNSGYWLQKPYLGVGPSAHSYNGVTRQYNVANNTRYLQAIAENTIPCTIETLTSSEQINDYLLTSLRTKWGTDLRLVKDQWKYDLFGANQKLILEYQQKGFLKVENNILTLTKTGRLLADEITAMLFAD
jgi:oxygen-independent coproporphyrinogen-3 oxidase